MKFNAMDTLLQRAFSTKFRLFLSKSIQCNSTKNFQTNSLKPSLGLADMIFYRGTDIGNLIRTLIVQIRLTMSVDDPENCCFDTRNCPFWSIY